MVDAKIISSLEKVMPTSDMSDFAVLKLQNAAKGERVSFQIVLKNAKCGREFALKMSVRSALLKYITVSRVGYVPSMLPAYTDRSDDYYITKQPGLFPDVLYPVKRNDVIFGGRYYNEVLWFTVDLPKDMQAADYPICFTFTDVDGTKKKLRTVISVKNVTIEKSDLLFTQWFHCDCIADCFGVKMMSKRHWTLIENFIKTAARTGITMLLTPLFTPPLDTEVGSERPTMQLVGVTQNGDKYEFDFSLLERWVGLCRKYGINHFEMSHLFTQWGVASCPKVVVSENGILKKKFGWKTPAMSDEYKNFLSQLLPRLCDKLRDMGIAENCYFHISDEPSADPAKPDYDNYVAAKNFVAPLIPGFKIMDALSHAEFYDNGLIQYPVCATNYYEPFAEREISERWCYYCCGQGDMTGNRFFAMPSYRNRVLGVQMYAADIYGFLQWGYNFYYSALSKQKINPYCISDAVGAFPSGDAYSVYPYKGGAIESLRTVVFYQGLQDRMLLKMLEKKQGREKTLELVNGLAGEKIDFKHYPMNSDYLVALHDRVLELLSDQ